MALTQRKLKRILEERFPPPDKVEVCDEDRFIGVVTSRSFRRLDGVQRQNIIHDVLKTSLTPAERRQVVIIVGVTPEEELASARRRLRAVEPTGRYGRPYAGPGSRSASSAAASGQYVQGRFGAPPGALPGKTST